MSAVMHIENLGLYVYKGPIKVMDSFHAHFEVEVNYVYNGYMKYFMGESEFTLSPNRLCAFWGSTPHRLIEVGPGTMAGILTIPTTWFTQWALPKAVSRTVFEGGVLSESTHFTEPSLIDTWVRDFNETNRTLRRATQLELQAAFLRMSPREVTTNWLTESSTDVAMVMQVCRYITTNLQTQLTSKEIADNVGHHPNYVARVFRRIAGMSLQEYVTRQRVATAQRLLITTNESVEVIGAYSGFNSNSQFFGAFKKTTRETPLQFRKKNLKQDAIG